MWVSQKCYAKWRVVSGLLLSFAFASCGGSGEGLSSGSTVSGSVLGKVTSFDFNRNGEAEINFDQSIKSDEKFSIIIFSANPQSFQSDLTFSSENLNPLKEIVQENKFLSEPEAFHLMLREQEKNYADMEISSQNISLKKTVYCASGLGINIKVLTSLDESESFQNSCAILNRSTQNVDYYIDQEVLGMISESSLSHLIDEFEKKVISMRNMIGRESDVDKNGRFAVYLTPKVNQLGLASNSFFTGYFHSGDLFPESELSSSNEMEILYISVPDPNGQWGPYLQESFWLSNIVNTVLPHEYQHMINFNQKVLLRDSNPEKLWMNEALSHLFEDVSYDDNIGEVSEENPSRVQQYLSMISETSLTQTPNLSQRGGSYLFFRYLYEQANQGAYSNVHNGKELLRQLVQSDINGVENLTNVLNEDFSDLLADFFATLQLTNTNLSNDPSYHFEGINLRGSQNDNRGTLLDGIRLENFSDKSNHPLNNSSARFFEINAQEIQDLNYTLIIKTNPDMEAHGMIIRLQ